MNFPWRTHLIIFQSVNSSQRFSRSKRKGASKQGFPITDSYVDSITVTAKLGYLTWSSQLCRGLVWEGLSKLVDLFRSRVTSSDYCESLACERGSGMAKLGWLVSRWWWWGCWRWRSAIHSFILSSVPSVVGCALGVFVSLFQFVSLTFSTCLAVCWSVCWSVHSTSQL